MIAVAEDALNALEERDHLLALQGHQSNSEDPTRVEFRSEDTWRRG